MFRNVLTLNFFLMLFLASILNSVIPNIATASDIVGNWHLDEGVGQIAVDSSGNNLHGRFGSSKVIDLDDPFWVSRRFDTAAIRFKGDYVEVSNSPMLEPSSQITVETWVRSTNPVASAPFYNIANLVAKGAWGCSSASYALYTGSSGGLFFYVTTGLRFVLSPDAGRRIWDGKWHHVAGTYNGNLVRLFVDGIEVGPGTPTSGPINYGLANSMNGRLYFGALGDFSIPGGTLCFTGQRFDGDIDEVRIWKRALSPAEIAIRFRGD